MAFRAIDTPVEEWVGTTTARTSHPITMPSGTGGGILVLYAINTSAVSLTLPGSPWVLINQGTNSTGDFRVILWLPPGQTQANTAITSTSARSVGYVFRIGAGTSDVWTPEYVSGQGTDVNPDPPNFTPAPSWGTGDTTWMAVAQWRNGQTLVTGFPAGYTLATDAQYTNGASGVGLAWATKQLNAGTEDPPTFALTAGTNRQWVADTIAIPQLAVAAAPTVYYAPDSILPH